MTYLTGRPTLYTEDLASEILDRVAEGQSLQTISASGDHMPHVATICRWVAGTVQGVPDTFRERYRNAQRELAQNLIGQLIDIADNSEGDTVVKLSKNGTKYESCNTEWVQRSRLRLETRKYLIDRYLGTAATEEKKDEEAEKVRYVDAPPQAESVEEWLKRRQTTE